MLERWLLPDGRQLLELSTKCRPRAAPRAASALRTLLGNHRLSASGDQRTKTDEYLRRLRPPAS